MEKTDNIALKQPLHNLQVLPALVLRKQSHAFPEATRPRKAPLLGVAEDEELGAKQLACVVCCNQPAWLGASGLENGR